MNTSFETSHLTNTHLPYGALIRLVESTLFMINGTLLLFNNYKLHVEPLVMILIAYSCVDPQETADVKSKNGDFTKHSLP